MERTSPKRIRIDGCNAVVLEAEQVNEQLILAEGLAERAKVSVKEAGDREIFEVLIGWLKYKPPYFDPLKS